MRLRKNSAEISRYSWTKSFREIQKQPTNKQTKNLTRQKMYYDSLFNVSSQTYFRLIIFLTFILTNFSQSYRAATLRTATTTQLTAGCARTWSTKTSTCWHGRTEQDPHLLQRLRETRRKRRERPDSDTAYIAVSFIPLLLDCDLLHLRPLLYCLSTCMIRYFRPLFCSEVYIIK